MHSCSVDNLGNGSDHPHIDVSNSMLCFLTRKWFKNDPCLREFIRAILRNKPMIALLEPFQSDEFGGHTEAQARQIIESPEWWQRWEGFEERGEVAKWAKEWGQPGLKLPSAQQAIDSLFASETIEWSRLSDFRAPCPVELDIFLELLHGALIGSLQKTWPCVKSANGSWPASSTLTDVRTRRSHTCKTSLSTKSSVHRFSSHRSPLAVATTSTAARATQAQSQSRRSFGTSAPALRSRPTLRSSRHAITLSCVAHGAHPRRPDIRPPPIHETFPNYRPAGVAQ